MATSDQKKKKTITESRQRGYSRSDIPSELITHFAQRLQKVVDLKRCAFVCKTWRQAIVAGRLRPHDSHMPWTISWVRTSIARKTNAKFSDFWSSHTCSLYKRKTQEPGRKSLLDGNFRVSKHGWLLLSCEVKNSDGSRSSMYFFYNPFFNKIIEEVPPLNWPGGGLTTFTAAPTSPNCVIFVMDRERSGGSYILNTCKLKDREWSRHTIHHPLSTNPLQPIRPIRKTHATYTEGAFYFVFYGTGDPLCVRKFSFALQDWTVIEDCSSSFLNINSGFSEYSYSFKLLECDGEVFLAAVRNDISRIHVIRFDWSQKVSTPLRSVGKRVLFWSLLGTFAVPAEGESSEFANMIFWRSEWCECLYVYETEGTWIRSTRQELRTFDIDTWIEPLDLWG